jgi:hypothetical protein
MNGPLSATESAEQDRPRGTGTMLDAALGYAAAGWPIHPCRPDGKEPLTASWIRDATTDPATLTAWWRRWPRANPAVACGAPGPDVLDIDVKDGRAGMELFDRARRAGLLSGAAALVRSPSGGLHVWFEGTDQRGGAVGKDKALELKARGGYVLLPPAYVVSEQYGYAGCYELIERREGAGTIDFAAVRRLLDPPPAPPRPLRRPRDPNVTRPGDDFNARASWAEILQPHGWVFVRQQGSVGYWRRRDKPSGISATTNATGTDRLRVFTTSTEFDTTSYSKFGAYAVLNHDGDHRAATRALRAAGYGAETGVPA